ncbi:MAG: TonB-dependent receptor [Deltaproteobacteria bacterium]|nr:TonB-dependent receptor [Deltaproteobacteria bacterium]
MLARACTLVAAVVAGTGAVASPVRAAGPAGDASPADDPRARVIPPEPLSEVVIEYPTALAEREPPPRGEVVVRFVVGVDGVPFELSIEQSLVPELDALALEAVGRLRFRPASLDGAPVEIATRLAIPFEPPAAATPDPVTDPVDDADTPPDAGDAGVAGDAAITGDDASAGALRLRGAVLEAGQRTPVEGATIVVVPAPDGTPEGRVKKRSYADPAAPPWQVTRRSDQDGSFTIRGTPATLVRVVVLAPGFERIEYVERLTEGESLEVKYYLQRLPSNPYRTVVRSIREEREEVARRTITPAEIGNLPGTQGDALKAIQNFPGVARAPFGLGLLAIRGTGPNDSAVFIGHHEVPLLYHFGGLTSVFNADILERIDFVPGNFDSRYGDVLGGIIDVQPRKGRRDGYHGYIDSDIFDSGFLVEGKLGKGSFAVAARRSYIDLLLPRVIPDDAGINLTLAPRYWDDQILFDYPLGGGEFSVRVFGSSDKLKLVAADPNDVSTDDRDRFETSQYFHRVDLVYRKKKGPWEFLITPSYRYDTLQFGISDVFQFDLGVHNLTLRSELTHQASKGVKWRVGTELRSGRFTATVDAPPVAALMSGDTGAQLQSSQTGWLVIPAVYSTVDLTPGERVTLSPGVRVSYFGGIYSRASVEPRLRGAVQVADKTVLKAGVGMFTQAGQPVEASKVFGNPRVGLERAVQTSLGVSQQLPYAISIDATGFFTYLYDEIAPSTAVVRRPDGSIGPETFANSQTGRTYGLEILARKQLTGSVFGWVAYTLNRSERRAAPSEPMLLADFDQTHILTLVGVWRLPRNWQIGGRFRLVSGNPYTPTIGAVYDASQGSYLPIDGRRNSSRLPAFHQLDIRIDKTWVWRRVKLSLYLDVQNVYNHQNTEFLNQSYDFTTQVPIAGLPIIPSLGTKLEF